MLKMTHTMTANYSLIEFRYGSQPGGKVRVTVDQIVENGKWEPPNIQWPASNLFEGPNTVQVQIECLTWALELYGLLQTRTDKNTQPQKVEHVKMTHETWEAVTRDQSVCEQLKWLHKDH